MELSVALVLFFFFFLAASGMLTGWLFSFSVSKKDNLLTTTSGHTLKFLLYTSRFSHSRAVLPVGPWLRCCLSSEITLFSSTALQLCPIAREFPCYQRGGHMEGREGGKVRELPLSSGGGTLGKAQEDIHNSSTSLFSVLNGEVTFSSIFKFTVS